MGEEKGKKRMMKSGRELEDRCRTGREEKGVTDREQRGRMQATRRREGKRRQTGSREVEGRRGETKQGGEIETEEKQRSGKTGSRDLEEGERGETR